MLPCGHPCRDELTGWRMIITWPPSTEFHARVSAVISCLGRAAQRQSGTTSTKVNICLVGPTVHRSDRLKERVNQLKSETGVLGHAKSHDTRELSALWLMCCKILRMDKDSHPHTFGWNYFPHWGVSWLHGLNNSPILTENTSNDIFNYIQWEKCQT